jgi:hypothetical protein
LLSEKLFWIAAGERAVKTFAQSLVALFAAGVTILNIDWQQGLAVAATAAVVSVLTSVASVRLGQFEGPSLAGEAVVEPVYEIED